MAKIKSTDIEFDESFDFEQKVAAEQAELEKELSSKGRIDPPAPQPDPRLPKQRGLVKSIAFKKEITDMALDVLIQLNNQPLETSITLQSGAISITGHIDNAGTLHISWSGIIDTKD